MVVSRDLLPRELIGLLFLKHRSFGRYRLSKLIGISENKTRMLFDVYKNTNLIVPRVGRAGATLSNKGFELMTEISKLVKLNYKESIFQHPSLLTSQGMMASILLKKGNIDTIGLEERDIAVRHGARGGTTIIKEKFWHIPPLIDHNSRTEIKFYTEEGDYNVIFIVFGPKNSIYRALASIVLFHLEDEISDIFSKYFTLSL